MIRRAVVATSVMTAACVSVAVAVVIQPAQAESNERAGEQAIRTMTEQYRDVEQALADGFVETECVEVLGLGGMGYHYINFERIDGVLRSNEPEVLLYRDNEHGEKVLTGVEYMVVDADQDLSTVERHQVFGHVLHGPMEGHGPGMPVHYDRHAWVWEANPNGTWADWNPNVTCSE